MKWHVRSASPLTSLLLIGIIAVLMTVVLYCSDSPTESNDDENGNGGPPSDLPGAVTESVSAASGDTLTTSEGAALVIGSNALPSDTSVTLVSVSVSDTDDRYIAGARMEPEGLILDSAVIVQIPLPADWEEDDTPLVLEFKGNDPSTAVATGAYALVSGSPGAYIAEVLISHFSGVVCARNCHAGTIRYVLEEFEGRGCHRDSLLGRVRGGYEGVNVPPDGCGLRGVETVQAFLDTYFEDIGGFNAGEPVPADLMAQTIGYRQSGREVVLAFKPGEWGSRGGEHNFYPTSAIEYSHTAPLDFHDGKLQIRNTLATGDQKLIDALGGNIVWYPFDQVNEFRELPQGVATELQLGLDPGDLSAANRNPYGLDLYHPLEGLSYWGRAWSDPWTYLFSEGSWSGIPPRSVPWTAVRIYVERLDGPQHEMCPEEEDGSTLSASVTIPGYSRSFTPLFVAAAMGSYNGDTGYPGVMATSAATWNPATAHEEDILVVFLDKDLSAPGTYSFTEIDLALGDAILAFTTPLIRDEGTVNNVVFSTLSGTLTLEQYGTSEGQRLKGTFSTNVSGERETTPPDHEDPEEETINGTINGSFDAVIGQLGKGGVRVPAGGLNIGAWLRRLEVFR